MSPSCREALAAAAHQSWSGWMKYLFSQSSENPDGSVTIPPELVARWIRQMDTDYVNLPVNEKESDREEAERYGKAILETLR